MVVRAPSFFFFFFGGVVELPPSSVFFFSKKVFDAAVHGVGAGAARLGCSRVAAAPLVGGLSWAACARGAAGLVG